MAWLCRLPSIWQENIAEGARLIQACFVELTTSAGGCGSSSQRQTAGMMGNRLLVAGAQPGRGQAGGGPLPAHRGRARRHRTRRLQPPLRRAPARHRTGGPPSWLQVLMVIFVLLCKLYSRLGKVAV